MKCLLAADIHRSSKNIEEETMTLRAAIHKARVQKY
jgi:hypothetical protein